MLSIQQDLEEELVEQGFDPATLPSALLAPLVDTLVPGPSASAPSRCWPGCGSNMHRR